MPRFDEKRMRILTHGIADHAASSNTVKARHIWTEEEERVLRDLYPHTSASECATRLGVTVQSIYFRAHRLGLHKAPGFRAEVMRRAWAEKRMEGSQAYLFKKGQTPANKGLRRPGWSPGRMAETQFKPGVVQGRAAALVKPIGAERVSKQGYLQRKVNNDMPFQKRWRAVHLLVWEAANGPVPEGHAIMFKDGDKRNFALDNLVLVSRSALMARNTIHNYGEEIAHAALLRGAITRQINRRKKA